MGNAWRMDKLMANGIAIPRAMPQKEAMFFQAIAHSQPKNDSRSPSLTTAFFKFWFPVNPFMQAIAGSLPTVLAGLLAERITINKEKAAANTYDQTET